MAIDYLTTNLTHWNAALANLNAARAAVEAVSCHPQCKVHDDILALEARAADGLYEIPPRTLGGLRQKLEFLWGQLWDENPGTDFKRIILGDLCRIELLQVGVDPEEASGGMDLEKLALDWTEAAREYDGLGLDSATEVDEAKILFLRAPDLAAVERKLSIIWSGSADSADETSKRAMILRDLRHFLISDQH